MIAAQEGDPDAPLPTAKESETVVADRDGVLVEQQALPFGVAAWRLGAGRARKEHPVDHAAGIDLHAKPGDAVTRGQPLFTMHTEHHGRFKRATEALEGAYRIGDPGDEVLTGGPLIAGRVPSTGSGQRGG
jgi:thymidine phosphorylase